MGDARPDALRAELAALGRAVRVPEPGDAFADAVLARLPDRPAVRRRRQGWRWLVAALTAVFVGVLAAPPVRAQLADWFGFAGVRVHTGPAPTPSLAPAPPASASSVSTARAQALVRFPVRLPAALGPPDDVRVSPDRRVVSATWATPSGPVRLDQFDGHLDYVFAKTAPDARWVTVDGAPALWFDAPHAVVVLQSGGAPRTESARLAGHTLIWERGEVTMRLEGDLTLERAVAVAASVPA
jgi:hypothetical protein